MNEEIKSLLQKYKISANPKLDQHFMIDEGIISRIVSSAEINSEDVILEIGAGLGAVSKRIPQCKKLVLVEIDPQFVHVLNEIFSAEIKEKKAVVINENALEIIDDLKFSKIISNLPYSICEPIFHKLFGRKFQLAIFAVPSNFYKKLLEAKITFTLIANSFYKFDKLCDAKRTSFYPVPDVDSVIMRVSPKEPLIDAYIVQKLYFQRDKKVKNALMETLIDLYGLTKRKAKAEVQNFHLDEEFLNKDAHDLLYDEYINVVEKIKNVQETAQQV
ncbi:MAG TPA: rRNA adenine N-6-methyltransferase family protein [Candidatus Nanoarchaeia archaeon]|nr:rRNA adenine N-6-methyltransferase family protein [Candidatus Nanoarchaeia archaeon]